MAPPSINSRSSSFNNNDEWWNFNGATPPVSVQPLESKEFDINALENTMSGISISENGLHRIIIGVDFGTTYTGVSFVSTAGSHNKDIGDINVVQNWPGPSNDAISSWKAPSRIAYHNENQAYTQQNRFGFDVTAKMKSYSWMKLLLDPERSTHFDDPSLAASEGQGVLRVPPGKSGLDVCADYLTEIATFAYDEIKKSMGEDVVLISPLEFWFTVPAVWSDRAKSATLRAAERAAMNTKVLRNAEASTFLIAEPEAAAVATIAQMTQGGSTQQIKPGDSILICDCGGGTVDITTYQVTTLEPMVFNELLIGTGGKCGSTFIDRRFIAWMEEHFGESYTNLGWEKRGPGSIFMKAFESLKKDFGTSNDPSRVYEMMLVMKDVKDSRHYNTEESEVRIYYDDMKQLFDPVISLIVELVEGQLDEEYRQSRTNTIKTVMLVGGFGDSRYLNNILKERCEARGVRLICPPNPQAAIVRGAALSGLHNLQPSSRRARRHYGSVWNETFDKSRHLEEHKFFDNWSNQYKASGNMHWSLEKGGIVTGQTQISIRGERKFSDSKENFKWSQDMYCCDLDYAPAHVDDKGVYKLASFEVDLTSFDTSNCERKTIDGHVKVKIKYELQINFSSKKGVLNFVCLYAGKEAGRTSITFDGQDPDHGAEDDDQSGQNKSCAVM